MVKTLFALKLAELRDVSVELELVEGVEELERKKKPKVAAIVRKIYDADLKTKVIAFFERPEIDGWEAQHGFHNPHVLDLVPVLPIIIAWLKACRRLNDIGLILYSLNHQNEVFHSRMRSFCLTSCMKLVQP
ncbi:COX5A [Lepeophtheirus salmonis]|uniref:Cytochrome c oxidase subunit 5A, mitochondrial n=1 Tax=Lepeophtheirus salmonis TaxID=72036 RepID=A0A7R8CXR4_LEPSM|nr:COX5A [Lepeophtheirus salmonis]CAF2962181.1 COX5A [Lepeophtheirus salmonis]